MSVYKRGDVYWITVSVGGGRSRQSAGKGATLEEAKELEAKIRGDHHAGRVGRSPSRTITEALLRWLEGEAALLKSHDNLLDKVRTLRPFVKGRQLSEIATVAGDARAAWIKAGLKVATINRRLAILRRVSNLAFNEWGWLTAPVKIKLLPGETHRQTFLTPNMVTKLAAASPDPVASQAILLAAYSGLRKSELLGLLPEHIHGSEIRLGTATKSGRGRIVPVPAFIVPILKKVPLGLTENQLRVAFEAAREHIGKPGTRFHDLRHTYASWLIQNGADLVTVRDLLGHSTIAITADLYSHLVTKHLRAAVKRLPGHNPVTARKAN